MDLQFLDSNRLPRLLSPIFAHAYKEERLHVVDHNSTSLAQFVHAEHPFSSKEISGGTGFLPYLSSLFVVDIMDFVKHDRAKFTEIELELYLRETRRPAKERGRFNEHLHELDRSNLEKGGAL